VGTTTESKWKNFEVQGTNKFSVAFLAYFNDLGIGKCILAFFPICKIPVLAYQVVLS
jgi:hypothetical protein